MRPASARTGLPPRGAGRRRVQVGASLGVAAAPDQARGPDDLLHHADLAMYARSPPRRRPVVLVGGEPGDDARVGPPPMPRSSCSISGWPSTGGRCRRWPSARQGDQWPRADLGALGGACAAASRWWPTTHVPVELSVGVPDLAHARAAGPGDLDAAPGRTPTAVMHAARPGCARRCPGGRPHAGRDLRSRGIPTGVEADGSGAAALARLRELPVRPTASIRRCADVVTDPRASLVVAHTVALDGPSAAPCTPIRWTCTPTRP